MTRPDNMSVYDEIDLKLGIKSSLPNVRSTVALVILLWECSGHQSELYYSEQSGNNIVINHELKKTVIDYLKDILAEEKISSESVIDLINNNQLYKSQIESLIVAFELVWKLAKFDFVDESKTYSAERTGGIRYPKKISYSVHIDIIHSLISENKNAYIKVLLSWIGVEIDVEHDKEENMLYLLSALSEESVFKLTDGEKDVIFNQNSIYKKIVETNEGIDVSGDKEAKGSLRILKSLLHDGMNPYLIYNTDGTVNASETTEVDLESYQKRVDVYLRLSSTKVIEKEANNNGGEEASKTGTVGKNIILYGVPGSGKSHEIKTEYCDDQAYMERAVFHPDYTYSDFVGQILPKIIVDEHGKKTVTYDFSAGPFTEIMKKAVNDKEKKKYYLVVEEINRGNAPAIFGDIFQLLDRDDSGESEYGISNEAIAEYVYGNKDEMVKIPSNLFILATMNTSDQNVFTLDTAFKRRWEMKRIKNNVEECDFANHKICGSGVTWKAFVNAINEMIIEVSVENLSNEDNRLGAYFVKESELDDSSLFGEKVLMYLWNDAFRYDHEKIFKSEYHTLDDLIDGFEDKGFDIFVDSDRFDYQVDFEVKEKTVSIETYLDGKKDYLLKYYGAIRDYVKERIPDIREESTPSLQYAAWRSDSISKSSFADLTFRNDKLIISTEIPRKEELKGIGEIIPKDNHHNHYYRIIYDDTKLSEIVEIIVDSYEQLKSGEEDA